MKKPINPNSTWKKVQKFYKDSFGISPKVVDLMADKDVLFMCVSGASNKSISNTLDIDLKYVDDIVKKVFLFDGWEFDLNYSPYQLYSKNAPLSRTVIELPIGTTKTTAKRICKIYDKIQSQIDENWK